MKSKPGRRIGIIGAGPAGLTAAYELVKSGFSVALFEAEETVGGLCRTISIFGSKADLGPHRFLTDNDRVKKVWFDVIKNDYSIIERNTRIFFNNHLFFYPLKAVDCISNLGNVEALRCILSYILKTPLPNVDNISFEEWVTYRFGRRLYEIFFKSYSEKLWGIPCKKLDAMFAIQRIKGFSLMEAIRDLCGFNGSSIHRTLANQFIYPHGGASMPYERMAKYITNNGGELYLNCPIRKVIVKAHKAIGVETHNGEIFHFDHIISTMPLTTLVKQLPNIPESVSQATDSLAYRNTLLVFLHIGGSTTFSDHWIYLQHREIRAGRITNFRNWGSYLHSSSDTTVLALEYWAYDYDPLWEKDDRELIEMATRDIQYTRLIDNLIIDADVCRLRFTYPVYKLGFRRSVEKIAEYLNTLSNLTLIGRAGTFNYNNQDQSILMGLLAADNVRGAKHNLWTHLDIMYRY